MGLARRRPGRGLGSGARTAEGAAMTAPRMTRTHYEYIANALRANTPIAGDGPVAMRCWRSLVTSFANRLEATNAGFNRERFLRACGMAEERERPAKPFRCAICGQTYKTLGARERCMDAHG